MSQNFLEKETRTILEQAFSKVVAIMLDSKSNDLDLNVFEALQQANVSVGRILLMDSGDYRDFKQQPRESNE